MDKWAFLRAAGKEGYVEVVQYLVEECSADVNATPLYGGTAFMKAVRSGDSELVQYLVEQCSVNVKATTQSGGTALMEAARCGNFNLISYLVEHCDADVNAKTKYGETALMQAAYNGRIEVIRCLVEQCRIDVNAKTDNGGTALMKAASSGNVEIVQYLVELCGAEVSAKCTDGRTALMEAARSGNPKLVQCLIGQGRTDVNAQNNDGQTALMEAGRYGHVELVRYLVVECGADVNAQANDGQTALLEAVQIDNRKLVRCLVEQCGADVNAVNNDGNTALRIAANCGYNEVQQILRPFVVPVSFTAANENTSNVSDLPTRDRQSWSIPPPELELILFAHNGHIGGDFRAKWLDADVVVKLFIADAAHSTFEDEVSLWQQLRHPNVTKMYGACDVGPLLKLFVCEYSSNGSLQELVAFSSVEKPTTWKYLHEAALGLEFLHERGIVHGDLRCSNILIGDDGLAKLSNFGRSELMKKRNLGVHQDNDGAVGSVRWQAPEVLKGKQPSYASDVYSLGMCILEAATGDVPWSLINESDVKLYKEIWNPKLDLFGWGPGHIVGITQKLPILMRMCSRKPCKRPSLSSVVYELECLANKECIGTNSRQPENEPVDRFEYGKLNDAWVKLQAHMETCEDVQYHRAFNDIRRVYDGLRDAMHRSSLLERFFALLTDFYRMVKMPSEQARIMRLSSTRATSTSLYSLRWRINALLTSLADIFLLLKDLKSTEEQSALLKTEMKNTLGKYSSDQLGVIQKAYDDITNKLEKEGNLSGLAPEWFIPWYELIVDEWSCLGTGGFGSVFRAKWLDSDVAVKRVTLTGSSTNADKSTSTFDTSQANLSALIQSEPTATQIQTNTTRRVEAVAMFRREVDIWFGLSHPHVVRLFGACHVGRPFFVCEYATNGTLANYLRANTDQLWSKLYEAALGVQYLHARNVVHGDLKGNNIVIGSDKKAKVTDFGLSSLANNESTPQVSAAWHWVAPECLNDVNTRSTPASDVYSLGMCIVEALRVVEAVKGGKEPNCCLPWSNPDKNVVNYHATRGTLLSRPAVCDDRQWELVTRMCALYPEDRIKISTVVDELAKFMTDTNVNNQDDNLTIGTASNDPVEINSTAEMITAARVSLTRLHDDPRQHDEVLALYTSFLDRLNVMRGRIDDTFSVGCRTAFCSLIGKTSACTAKLAEASASHVSLAETTMRCYALNRRLDKFCDAYFIDCEAKDLKNKCTTLSSD